MNNYNKTANLDQTQDLDPGKTVRIDMDQYIRTEILAKNLEPEVRRFRLSESGDLEKISN